MIVTDYVFSFAVKIIINKLLPNLSMFECSICDYHYDRGNKKPLVLPCGHSYCEVCVHDMRSSNRNACPECRQNWGDVEIAKLAICYQLMPEAQQDRNEETSSEPLDSCEEHGFKNAFWCLKCRMPLCKNCLNASHKKCDWCLIETAVEKEVECLETTVGKILSSIDEATNKVHSALERNNSKLSTLRMFKMKVKELETEVINFEGSLNSAQEDLDKGKRELNEMNTGNFDANKLRELVKTDKISQDDLPSSNLSILFEVAEAFQVLFNLLFLFECRKCH